MTDLFCYQLLFLPTQTNSCLGEMNIPTASPLKNNKMINLNICSGNRDWVHLFSGGVSLNMHALFVRRADKSTIDNMEENMYVRSCRNLISK